MGEKISAFWIAIVLIVAIIWISFTLSQEPPKDIRPETESIPVGVTEIERESETPPPITREIAKKEDVIEKEIDPYELELLAKVVQTEAGYCSDELRYAVGSVVLNRVNSPKFPNTVEKVIFQKNPVQYSTADRLDKVVPTEEAWKAAEDLLKNGVTIPNNVIWQANFEQGTTWKIIDGVYFGY